MYSYGLHSYGLRFLQVMPEEPIALRRLLATANLEKEETLSRSFSASSVSPTASPKDRAAMLEAKLTAIEAQQRVEKQSMAQAKVQGQHSLGPTLPRANTP